MHPLAVILALMLPCAVGVAKPKTLIEWSFAKGAAGWAPAAHIADLRVVDGALQGRITGAESSLRGPRFNVAPTPWQHVELRLKTDCDGQAKVRWFSAASSGETPFRVVGDGGWHGYQVFPFWHTEKQLSRLCLSLPTPTDGASRTFALAEVRIVDIGAPPDPGTRTEWDFTRGLLGWSPFDSGTTSATPAGLRFANGPFTGSLVSGPLRCSLLVHASVSLEFAVDKGTWGQVRWVSSEVSGVHFVCFPLQPDGKFHRYNVSMSGDPAWRGDAVLLGLSPSDEPGATATIRSLSLATAAQGPTEMEGTDPNAVKPND